MYFVTFMLKNIFRRKVRSGLTVAAVAVAVGTMVSLLGLSHNFERANAESFEGRGVDLIVTAAGVPNQLNSDLDEAAGDRIQQIPGVARVTPGLLELVTYRKGNSDVSVFIQGFRYDRPDFDEFTFHSGRRFGPGERRVAVMGETVARNLNKTAGDTIEIQQEEFRVLGVFESFDASENGSVVVALPELQELLFRKNRVTGFSVILDAAHKDRESVEAVRQRIDALGNDKGKSYGLSARPTREYLNTAMHLRMARAMAWTTTVIALVIGTIGMLNSMLMSVIERTREIGILRAIGWRKGRVARLILGESLLLSVTGAVLGTAAAVGVVRWLTSLPWVNGMIRGEIAPTVLAEGLAMALVVGFVGGALPAARAVRLVPREAIHHE
jgi:putative ABC transport system permease protein